MSIEGIDQYSTADAFSRFMIQDFDFFDAVMLFSDLGSLIVIQITTKEHPKTLLIVDYLVETVSQG